MYQDNDYEEEQQFVADYESTQRTSISASLPSRTLRGLKDITNMKEQFKLRVEATVRNLSSIRGCIALDDLLNVLEPINDLPYIQFKNATAFVLGYIASEGGKSISRTSVAKAIKCREEMILPSGPFEDIVSDKDIIKYAVYWKDVIMS